MAGSARAAQRLYPPPTAAAESGFVPGAPSVQKSENNHKIVLDTEEYNHYYNHVGMEEDLELLRGHLERHHEKQAGPDGCWLWTGQVRHTNSGPRGCIDIGRGVDKRKGRGKGGNKRRYIAHRAAYRVWVGPIPAGHGVCHSCDVSLCIRPEHLFPGTQEDNMVDAAVKGRIRNGSYKGQALFKLSDGQVAEIRARRAAGESGVMLGKEFGVHHATIYKIANGKRRAA
jgi:hypothetical protein